MSVEKLVERSLWSVVGAKLVGDTLATGSVAARTVASIFISVGNCFDVYAQTALMVECHYAQRYELLTGRNLGVAIGQGARHVMTSDDLRAAREDARESAEE